MEGKLGTPPQDVSSAQGSNRRKKSTNNSLQRLLKNDEATQATASPSLPPRMGLTWATTNPVWAAEADKGGGVGRPYAAKAILDEAMCVIRLDSDLKDPWGSLVDSLDDGFEQLVETSEQHSSIKFKKRRVQGVELKWRKGRSSATAISVSGEWRLSFRGADL